ncbi:MAG: hypothetical protein U0984_02365, partial [Prosthecobacter sp.]|nr:hypothetical protein [Prosthecobacter sp.]
EEKELPVKDRSREATRAPDAPGERPKTAERDGEKPRTGERDGMRKKPVEGERDGEVKKTGPRDGEGDKKPGPRDGEVRKTASREGENGKKPGPRDGEIKKTGARDGEGTRTGPKDGEKQKTVERDGDRPAKTAEKSATGESIVLRVVKGGEAVRVGEEEIPMNGLRGYLQKFLPQHRGAKVTVTGDPDVSYKSLTGTVDAVRDNGHKHVGIAAP